jgi:hypothetical protein
MMKRKKLFMPAQPSWLDRLNTILETLDGEKYASLPFLTRASIERLFGLKRRQAINLMKKMHRFQVGKEFVVDRSALKNWLRKAEIGEKVWFADVVRTRIEELVEEALWEREARKPRIVVPQKTGELDLAGMPPTVTLRPGEMRIEFFGAEDLFRQLFEIAQVIRNDYNRFSALCEDPRAAPAANATLKSR